MLPDPGKADAIYPPGAWRPLAGSLPFGPADQRPLPMPPVIASPPATPASAIPLASAPPNLPSRPRFDNTALPTAPTARVSLEWTQPPDVSEQPRGFLTHRVRSGETLSSLARRYLGSSDRYREIYLANRDVLATPDRLTAGMELKIPMSGNEPPPVPLPPVTSQTMTSQTSMPRSMTNSDSPHSQTRGVASDTMVPIQQGVWRRSDPARLAQRTYAVRREDTLAGIALQFYGDARRYNELYEANRHQMRSPDDLRDGMVLVIP